MARPASTMTFDEAFQQIRTMFGHVFDDAMLKDVLQSTNGSIEQTEEILLEMSQPHPADVAGNGAALLPSDFLSVNAGTTTSNSAKLAKELKKRSILESSLEDSGLVAPGAFSRSHPPNLDRGTTDSELFEGDGLSENPHPSHDIEKEQQKLAKELRKRTRIENNLEESGLVAPGTFSRSRPVDPLDASALDENDDSITDKLKKMWKEVKMGLMKNKNPENMALNRKDPEVESAGQMENEPATSESQQIRARRPSKRPSRQSATSPRDDQ